MSSFADIYSNVLSPFVKRFRAAKNEKGRKTVIKDAALAVREGRVLLEDHQALPKDLPTTIRRHLKASINNESTPKAEEPKPKKVKPLYTLRDVVKQNYRTLIDEEIPYKSSDKAYLGSYQKAVTTVINNLGEEELLEAENLVELWNKEGGPSDVQLKRAKTRLPKDIQKSVDQWKFSSGALVLCLVAYPDGRDVSTFHIESVPNVANSFTKTYPGWKEGTCENFNEWALKQFGVKKMEAEDIAELPVNFQKAKNIEFKKNRAGHLILPPLVKYKTIRQKQRVVRGYIGASYRAFTGSKIASFPYISAAKEDQTIFSKECVPKGFVLSDPDHLTGSQIQSLYRHWLLRQQKKLVPFIILNPGPLHQLLVKTSAKAKGKRKIPYEHVNSDDEEVKTDGEEEEDEEDESREEGGDVDSDKEGDDEVADEEGDETFKLVKFGPPIGKGDSNLRFNQLEERHPVASSSKLPPVKPSSPVIKRKTINHEEGSSKQRNKGNNDGRKKIDRRDDEDGELEGEEVPVPRPNTRNSAKNISKKRKPEEDLASMRPQKILKGEPLRNEGGTKRKAADEVEPPVTRKRLREAESSPKKAGKGKRRRSPTPLDIPQSSPSKHQGRVREVGRVKEFPAGNTASSGSRMAFLRNLCSLPKFRLMVDLIPAMPKPSPIPKNFPPWASWTSREVYLPAEFHNVEAFNKYLSIVEESFGDSSVLENGQIDSPLLLLGLIFREVSRAMEIEPGEPTMCPPQLVHSPLGFGEMVEIEEMINELVLSLDQ